MTDSGGSFHQVFHVFNTNSVQYLVVGGTAVSYYGDFRRSMTANGVEVDKPDLDLWYNPTYRNYYKLLKAVGELGVDVTRYMEEAAPDPQNSFFRYELESYTLDLLPRIRAGLKFSEAFARRELVEWSGVKIPFINLDNLIQDKQTMGRPKDMIDIENLRRNNPSQVP